ncbi:hypothetical protein CLU79DRAFT_841475 [Phycomyces nitens]|nr:hypothetical protein CLU79DRAFT_841475 [Phycomyces nitens]
MRSSVAVSHCSLCATSACFTSSKIQIYIYCLVTRAKVSAPLPAADWYYSFSAASPAVTIFLPLSSCVLPWFLFYTQYGRLIDYLYGHNVIRSFQIQSRSRTLL